ncbi:uncharacterized protein TrAFT101_007950 [Trichoderma asperellum]|uniref:uncharacterized protein n=1 Tax=Trichoderma asperellum TaxID=101201 RepID=UPI003326ADBC|nr:hypothetical protein TrAFT101_007950 [Trichoderma asperellum]
MKPTQLFTLVAVFSPATLACLEHLMQERAPDPSDMVRRQKPAPRLKTAIKNVRVFDGVKLTGPQTVIIDGEYISNDASNIETTVNGNGGVLIPGLIDSHVHISSIAGLEILASYGVTTALNMACRNYTQCAPLRNVDGVASFISAGIPATGPGSQHSKTFNLTAPYLIYPDQNATEIVSYTFGNNSDFYKITAEINGPSQSMQNALVDAVHNLGKLSMTHASDLNAWAQAAMSGTNGIQHIPTNGRINASNILTVRKSSTTWSTPTMNIARYAFSNVELLTFTGHKVGGPDSYQNVYDNVKAIHAAGIPILAGTDAVGLLTPISPSQALRAATIIPAEHHQLTDRGQIAPGMRADLVLLNSNPLVDISNTRDIARVWIGGIEYKVIANSTGLSNPPANFTDDDGPSNSPSSGSGSPNSATASAALSWISFVSLQIGAMFYLFL